MYQINSSLPPVDIPIKIYLDGKKHYVIRRKWITNQDRTVTFNYIKDEKLTVNVPVRQIQWSYQ